MKNKIKNKNRFIASICFFVLFNICGLIGLYLIDAKTGFRAESLDENWYSDLIKLFGIVRIDISFRSTFFWALAYLGTLILIGAFIFRRTFLEKAEKNDVSPAKFHLVYFGVAAAIFLFGWLLAIIYYCLKMDGFKYLILMFGYFLLPALMFVLAAVIVYMIVCLIVSAVNFYNSNATTNTVSSTGSAVSTASGAVDKGRTVFPGLKEIDRKSGAVKPARASSEAPCTLPALAAGFQSFLSERCSLYYDLPMLRSFIAGMATSRLIILEGLSGTGKSSLPRYFSEYVGSKAFFAPVQATWRDRTDVLGFYNDFSGVFKETEFLKTLYAASYTPDKFNLMVLDEMNLSRIEYYFADFLSVMEYPADSWKINLMTHIPEAEAPRKLSDGSVLVPFNTWFVGTANKDDSTFTITDKVYDRAVVLEFNERNTRIATTASPDPISLSPNQLNNLFVAACRDNSNRLTVADVNKFNQLTQFVYDTFEIQFGNRIMNQIYIFVPVYVALGGTKEEAIDIMFSEKILHKLEGRFEDYVKDGLLKLQTKLTALYGAGVMTSTEQMIRRLLKKLL